MVFLLLIWVMLVHTLVNCKWILHNWNFLLEQLSNDRAQQSDEEVLSSEVCTSFSKLLCVLSQKYGCLTKTV